MFINELISSSDSGRVSSVSSPFSKRPKATPKIKSKIESPIKEKFNHANRKFDISRGFYIVNRYWPTFLRCAFYPIKLQNFALFTWRLTLSKVHILLLIYIFLVPLLIGKLFHTYATSETKLVLPTRFFLSITSVRFGSNESQIDHDKRLMSRTFQKSSHRSHFLSLDGVTFHCTPVHSYHCDIPYKSHRRSSGTER